MTSARSARRSLLALLAIGGIGAILIIRRHIPPPNKARNPPPAKMAAPVAAASTPTAPSVEPAAAEIDPAYGGHSELAERLNAQGGTVQGDLQILGEVFNAWQTNFPRIGNPVGENSDITAALTGTNELKFAFIPARHPAINRRGELCDRWGTPFRFHQLSGRSMEIRSAGPDRKFGTEDDAVFTPAP
jgi:hypothetical protein